jgi:hypothetical protein
VRVECSDNIFVNSRIPRWLLTGVAAESDEAYGMEPSTGWNAGGER